MKVLAHVDNLVIEVHPIAAQDWEGIKCSSVADLIGIPVFYYNGEVWPQPEARVRVEWRDDQHL